jgi:hypothetical protein
MCQTLGKKNVGNKRGDDSVHSKAFVHGVPFIVSPSTARLWHREPSSAETPRGKWCTQDHDKWDILYN